MGAPGISCYTPLVASCSTGGLVGIAFCVPDLLNVSVTTSRSLPLCLCWSLSLSFSVMHPFCFSIPLTYILLFVHFAVWYMLWKVLYLYQQPMKHVPMAHLMSPTKHKKHNSFSWFPYFHLHCNICYHLKLSHAFNNIKENVWFSERQTPIL